VDDNDEFDADLLLELTEEPDWSAQDYVEELYKAFRASSRYPRHGEPPCPLCQG